MVDYSSKYWNYAKTLKVYTCIFFKRYQYVLIPSERPPSKILNRPRKTMHSAASLRKKGKTLSLPLHAHSKHMGRRNILLGQGIF